MTVSGTASTSVRASVSSNEVQAIVLFSGPGGSSLGLRNAGVTRSVCVEFDPAFKGKGEQPAVATARAAGFTVIQEDVRTLDPRAVLGSLAEDAVGSWGIHRILLLLQASPPCQGLSAAGKGEGRKDLQHLLAALKLVGQMSMKQARQWMRWYIQRLTEACSDARSPLTFEVMRWIVDLEPDFVMLEQVSAALPIWQAIGEVLEGWGYSVWSGLVQAEQFGVPQTRKRAKMLAVKGVGLDVTPKPTHSKYHTRNPQKLDEGVEKWVSMAEALEWGREDVMVSNYGTGGDPSARGERKGWQPAPTVTSKIGRNVVHRDGEAVEDAGEWAYAVAAGVSGMGAPRPTTEPAATITGKGTMYFFDDPDTYTGPAKFERPFDVPDEEIVYVNGTHENAARRPADCPAPTVHFGARHNGVDWVAMGDVVQAHGAVRTAEQPAATITSSMDNGNFRWLDDEEYRQWLVDHDKMAVDGDGSWTRERPSATVVGSFAPDVVAKPGYRKAGDPPRQKTPGSVRVTVEEAGVLQSFPRDYPWRGTKTAQFQQVGNAVPPLLQQRLAEQLIAACDSKRKSDSASELVDQAA